MYITRLAPNEIFSPSNKIHREVCRAYDLSALLYINKHLVLRVGYTVRCTLTCTLFWQLATLHNSGRLQTDKNIIYLYLLHSKLKAVVGVSRSLSLLAYNIQCLQLHFNYRLQATQLQTHCINSKIAVTVVLHSTSKVLLSHVTHFRAYTEVRVVTVVRFTIPNMCSMPKQCTHVHCTVLGMENGISSKPHFNQLAFWMQTQCAFSVG